MKITVSMRAHKRHELRETGLTPNFNEMFAGQEGIRSVNIYDKGRCAALDIEESTLERLEKSYSDDFVFSTNIKFIPLQEI